MLRSFVLALILVSSAASAQDACKRGFEVAQELMPNPESAPLVTGDFDQDGRLDFLTVLTSEIRVLFNRGGAVFEPRTVLPLPTVAGVVRIHAADVTGEGRLDIVVRGTQAVHVAAGAGDGTFAPFVVTESLPADDVAVFVDMNGDGRRDFVSYGGQGEVFVHAAQPDGTFRPLPPQPARSTWALNLTPLAGGDFDGDGRTDLVYLSTTDRSYSYLQLQMLWQNSDGSFDSRYFEFHEYSIRGANVVPIEIDGDANTELVALHDGKLYVFDGAERRFTVRVSRVDGPVLNRQTPLATADLDRDGALDLVLRGQTTTVLWAPRDASGAYTQKSFDFIVHELADLNGDGTVDLLANGPVMFGVIYSRPGSRALLAAPVVAHPRTTESLFKADFDDDGVIDLARGDNGIDTTLFRGEGSTFTEALHFRGYRILAVADIDADGREDLVTESGPYGGPTYIHFATGKFAFSAPLEIDRLSLFEGVAARTGGGHSVLFRRGSEIESVSIVAGTMTRSVVTTVERDVVAIADIDSDGDSDLVIGDGRSNRLLIQDGANWTARPVELPLDVRFRRVEMADLDGDGRRDLVLLGATWALIAQPDGTFAVHESWAVRAEQSEHLADFDRDGRLDIVSTGCNTDDCFAKIQRNTGAGFELYGAFGINSWEGGQSILEDVDRDGWLDVVVAQSGGIAILRNVCARPGISVAATPALARTGDTVTLVVNPHARGFFTGPVTIRKNGAIVAIKQLERGDMFGVTTIALPPLPAGTHTFDVDYVDHLIGRTSTSITVTVTERGKRRRTVRH